MGVLGEILIASLFSILLSPESKAENSVPEKEKTEQLLANPSDNCITLQK